MNAEHGDTGKAGTYPTLDHTHIHAVDLSCFGERRSARCAICSLNNEEDSKHCIRCDALLRLKCPNCSKENPSEAVFCGGCATALSPADGRSDGAHDYHRTQIESENAMLAQALFAPSAQSYFFS